MKSGKYSQTISGHTFTAHFDVDGDYPQNKVSLSIGSTYPSHWIADLSPDGANNWEGDIWYRKDGAETLKGNSEGRISSSGSLPDKIRVWYGGYYAAGGFYYVYIYLKKSGTDQHWKYWYKKQSDHFREVNVEFDHEAGISPILSLNPHDVDNHRPASLPNEAISVESTFAKAGIIDAFTGEPVTLADNIPKLAGMPLYQLLGGKSRDGALVYAHATGADHADPYHAIGADRGPGRRLRDRTVTRRRRAGWKCSEDRRARGHHSGANHEVAS